jgi:hypothetical protein
LFEQGAYQSYGSEFTELRSWVLAQLLWNPQKNDRDLITTFVEGYYGQAAAPFIREYLDLMHTASAGWNLGCFSKTDTPFLGFKTLQQAERLWRQAEAAAAGSPDLLPRVQRGRMWLGYVWLSLWDRLRKECTDAAAQWPLPASRKAYADEWLKRAQGDPQLPWTKVTHLNESGLTPEKFAARFAND